MDRSCSKAFPKIDSLLDGALEREEARAIEAHVDACDACRAELESRRSLKRGLSALRLPPAPRRVTMADLRPSGWKRWTAAAAAILVIALVLLSLPAPLPEVVALSVQLHEDYLRGKLVPKELGLKVAIPGGEYVGQCACPPEMGASSPFIIYRQGATAISLLIAETEPRDLPASAHRTVEGRDFYFFRAGIDRVLVCQSGDICPFWSPR